MPGAAMPSSLLTRTLIGPIYKNLPELVAALRLLLLVSGCCCWIGGAAGAAMKKVRSRGLMRSTCGRLLIAYTVLSTATRLASADC